MNEQIQRVQVDWTHFWDEETREKVRPMLETVLEEYSEFTGETLQIGLTSSAKGRKPSDRDTRYGDKYYIQLNPERADRFTVAHELQHVLTREKIIDLRTIRRSPELLERQPSYLEVPEEVVKKAERSNRFQEIVSRYAHIALSPPAGDDFDNGNMPAKHFEQRMQEEAEKINQEKQQKALQQLPRRPDNQ